MKTQIKSVFGGLLYEGEHTTLCEAVEQAVKNGACLDRASLVGACLVGACLDGASLVGASLVGASLVGASLVGASLDGACLDRASLVGACLDRASLDRASLVGARLDGASFDGAKGADLVIARTRILPEGDLIGWKKCMGDRIVKLLIPADAKRSHAFGRKCRAEYVRVLEVIGAEKAISSHDGKTTYKAGEIVCCDKWCDDFTQECAGGIHFFITRIEAENYNL